LNFRTFARQEAAENEPEGSGSGPYPPAGWKPQGERLVLPARQQTPDEEFNGYHYPKPTSTYGPPPESSTAVATEPSEPETTTAFESETTTEPTGEETTEQSTDEPTTDDPTTDNPQAEGLKITPQKLTSLLRNQKVKLQSTQQQLQPVFFVQYPNGFIQQPQIFYVLE
jgi:hypothetical protein